MNRRKFISSLALGAAAVAAAPALAALPKPREHSLIAWLERIRATHRTNTVYVGADVLEFFRKHYGNTRGATVGKFAPDSDCTVSSFTKFQIEYYPIRMLEEYEVPTIIEPLYWQTFRNTGFELKVNPYWEAAARECVFAATDGKHIYSTVIDRKTFEVVGESPCRLNPEWVSAPMEIRWSYGQDPNDFST